MSENQRPLLPRLLLAGLFLALLLLACLFLLKTIASDTEEPRTEIATERDGRLTTIYKNRAIYEEAFADAAKQRVAGQKTVAMVTSHHLLAAPLIARSYASVPDSIERVILISPDHFHSRFSDGSIAFTTDSTWDGIFGDMFPDKDFIAKVSDVSQKIQLSDRPFLAEHGIYTEVPFLKHYFPQSEIVPLILKNDYDYQKFSDLGSLLRRESTGRTLLVISSDFSHNTTRKKAQEYDKKSVSVLSNLQLGNFRELNNDCRACIALLAGFLENEKYDFQLLENKNSTDFGGEDRDVTSYISGLFTLENGTQDSQSTVLFGGDLMFDRWIRTVARKRGGDFIFDGLRAEFQKADLVVANLEGPITDNPSVSETSVEGSHDNYVFTFPPETAARLKDENIGLVNIGNNHILNFEEDGVRQTKERLEAAGVGYFGSPLSGDERVAYREIGGVQFGFVNYNEFVLKGYEKVLADIALAKEQADFVIVYTHWGKEYVAATPGMKVLAHEFIDVGADLVIGSHPHVVQEREAYRGKMIYYSLGNFVFDQYFRPETQAGLLVRATFDAESNTIETEEIPIRLEHSGQTVPATR